MIDIAKDRKSQMYIVTKTDSEGFHRQLIMTSEELDDLTRQWLDSKTS